MSMMTDVEDYKAKRKHKRPCDLCGKPIEVGQLAQRWAWKDGGLLSSTRVHASCQEEAFEYDWYDDPDGWPDVFPLIEERAQQEAMRGTP